MAKIGQKHRKSNEMTDLVNRKTLALALGISERRVRAFVEQGRLSRTDDGMYSLAEGQKLMRDGVSLEHRERHRLSAGRPPKPNEAPSVGTKARIHQAAFKAKHIELRYNAERACLIEAAAVSETCDLMARIISERLDSWSPEFLAGMSDRGRAVFRALVDEVRDETVEALRKVA